MWTSWTDVSDVLHECFQLFWWFNQHTSNQNNVEQCLIISHQMLLNFYGKHIPVNIAFCPFCDCSSQEALWKLWVCEILFHLFCYQETPMKMNGIYIKSVSPGSPAALSQRLRPGDRLLAVNGHRLVGLDYHTWVDSNHDDKFMMWILQSISATWRIIHQCKA